MDETVFAQAGLFAVEVGLWRLVESWGVRPDFVAGHSVGEVAAAFAAGVFSLGDACRLVAARGGLMQALPEGGGMLAVQASLGWVEEVLSGVEGVEVAAVNGPSAIVVSGLKGGLDVVAERCAGSGVKARRLRVSHGFHSALMEPMLAEFERVVEGISFSAPRLGVVSNVTGGLVGEELCSAGYWVRHVREAVRFGEGVEWLWGSGVRKFWELGPDASLTALASECVGEAGDGVFVASMRRGRGEVETFTSAVSRLWASGVAVDWPAVFAGHRPRRVELPTYAFQRERYWLEEAGGGVADVSGAGLTAAGHPLLGAAVGSASDGGVLLTGRLSLDGQGWLADHAVAGTVLFPGTGFVELAVRAGDEVGCGCVRELTLQAPLVVPERGGVQVQVAVGPEQDGDGRSVAVYSRSEDAPAGTAWTLHAEGVVSAGQPEPEPEAGTWPPAGAEALDVAGFYERAELAGYGYGPAFRGLTAAWRRGEELFAEVSLPEAVRSEAGEYGLHPALLDAALHVVLAAEPEGEGLRLPFLWEDVSLFAVGATTARVHITPTGGDTLAVHLADEGGRPIALAESLTLRPVTAAHLAAHAVDDDALFRLDWTAAPSADDSTEAPTVPDWVVLGSEERGGLLAPGGRHADLASLVGAIEAGASAPGLVLCSPAADRLPEDLADAAQGVTAEALALVQAWLAEERLADSRLVVVTRGAVAVDGRGVSELTTAALWGLIRSAQSEYPDRFVLLDVAGDDVTDGELRAALACGESQVAVRGGRVLVPRLVRAASGEGLLPPAGESAWRLEPSGSGSLEGLSLVPAPDAVAPLAEGEVRIEVRAAGVNFRDVLISLGMYPGAAQIGSEVAGVVTEVGPGVSGLVVGDRV
ncbi:acyltransferase domain-containing protein, partial [Streptomyces chumphonensis]|uniref:acyltransferase domain-containing protein n=1 Tax=Streptomyces chumphonensis TaxID=1214925 RepID=UPI003D75AA4D